MSEDYTFVKITHICQVQYVSLVGLCLSSRAESVRAAAFAASYLPSFSTTLSGVLNRGVIRCGERA